MKTTAFLLFAFISITLLSQTTTTSVLSSGDWYKISVKQTGVYKLTYTDLVNLGINVSGIDPRNISIYGNGAGMLSEDNADFRYDDLLENAIQLVGEDDGVFNTNDYILFYAQEPTTWDYDTANYFAHSVNLYDDNTYYFLTIGSAQGKRIMQQISTTLPISHFVNTFDDYLHHEFENANLIKSGKLWFGEEFDDTLSRDFSFLFPNIDIIHQVTLNTNVAARSNDISNFSFYYNAQNILNIAVASVVIYNYTGEYAKLNSGNYSFIANNETITLQIDYDKPISSSIGWLDNININARRNLTMYGNQLHFRDIESIGVGNVSEFKLGNATNVLKIWDVTDIFNIANQEYLLNNDTITYSLITDSIREFIAFDSTACLTPISITNINNQNLHALDFCDLIIVSDPLFISEANNLANHHITHDGMVAHVVTPEQIYNEFSSGKQDVSAIRDFAKMFYDRATTEDEKPKYLLMFGDASYDYKDRIANNTNYVPTFQSEQSLKPTSSYCTDDFFVLLDSSESIYNGLIDIGVGRLPVKNQAEAQNLVSKIINYATNPATFGNWRNEICFVADDEDGNQHMSQANQLAINVETNDACYNLNKIYLDNYVQITDTSGEYYPDARDSLIAQFNDGALIINYTGHGNEIKLAQESIFLIDDIQNINNANNLPLIYCATVEFNRYDNPELVSFGEKIVLENIDGCIGSISSARLCYSTPNFVLNNAFYDSAFVRNLNEEYYKLGDLIRYAKNNGGSGINKRLFSLIGDPALTLNYPEHIITPDQINGVNITSFNDTIMPGSNVNISGYIEDIQGNTLNGFNGNIYYKLYNSIISDTTLSNDGLSPFIFESQEEVLISGYSYVVNGTFSINFIMPTGVNSNFDYGKLSLYTASSSEDAKGCFCDFPMGYGTSNIENPILSDYLNIYPTITSDYVNLEFSNSFKTINVNVYSISGTLMDEFQIKNIESGTKQQLDLSNYSKGMYLLQISNNQLLLNKKIIKN